MLTPHEKPFGQDDLCVSADEDMLENTKPNLISFSLSTSSSNHTNASAATNSDGQETESKCVIMCRKNGLKKSSNSTIENKKKMSVNLLMPIDAVTSSVTDNNSHNSIHSVETKNPCTNVWKDLSRNKCSEIGVKHNDFDVINFNFGSHKETICKNHSLSMHNLYEEFNSPRTGLVRVSSQPQLNSLITVKPLKRSVSSFSVKSRNRSYTHVQSKVKHYIQSLKSKREADESSGSVNEIRETISVPQCEQESLVFELQKEIQRLQAYLEERDTLLQEVQANHHSLLLQYGEAKNRLDHLRLVSVKPQQGMKSVQTESYSKVDKQVFACLPTDNNYPVDFKEIVSEACQSSIQRNIIHDVKQEETWENDNTNERSSSIDFSETKHLKAPANAKEFEELVLQRSTTRSPDKTLKVSTWFMSLPQQPLPVPSCYGSLASSGSVCNQPEDNKILELKEKLQHFSLINQDAGSTDLNETRRMPVINSQTKGDPKQNIQKDCSEEMTFVDANKCYLLSIDKCECWNTHDMPDYVTLEVESSLNSTQSDVKDGVPHTLSVPPLNLAYSMDNTSKQHSIPFQECNAPKDSDLCNMHTSSHACHSIASHNTMPMNFQKSLFNQTASFHEKCMFYLDTPTSYKSILINHEPSTKVNSDGTTGYSPCSVSCDIYKSRKSEFQYKSNEHVPKNEMESNCERKSSQCMCFHEKCVASGTNWFDNSHKCHLCVKSPDQMPRSMDCMSREFSKKVDSKILPDMIRCLNSVSACAEHLRRRSEAIQNFLTNLVETTSESH